MRVVASIVCALCILGACRDREPDADPEPSHAPPPPRRVIGPPAGGVRALPPHAIRSDGVGPYRLGAPVGDALAELPSGPRLPVLDVRGLVHCSVVRAEDDGVLVAGETDGSAITFVAVVHAEIARTERGAKVGMLRHELTTAVGDELRDRRWARDPRVYVGRALPGVRFLVVDDRVAAVMVTRAESGDTAGGPLASDAGAPVPQVPRPACAPPTAAAAVALVSAGDPGASSSVPVAWCPDDSTAITAVVGDPTITLVVGADDRPRRIASIDAPGVVYAAPIAADDRKDDLAVVSDRLVGDTRVVSVAIYRWDGGRLVRVADEPVYQLNAAGARWIGARVEDLDLLVELEAQGDDVRVSGALISRPAKDQSIHDVAPLVPVSVSRRRHAVPEPPVTDGGVGDAHGVDAQ
ncbi:MAG: hypothetical protein K8W52_47435 [Deltaproteobacteria bacterium]|nr:hypothetical protein [Deltaproteobacteria bacterium]